MATTEGNAILPPGSSCRKAAVANVTSWAESMDDSSVSDDDKTVKPQSTTGTARFYVIKRNEESFSKVSPFLIQKTIQSLVGDVASIKKLRSGDLLIEVSNRKQGTKLSQLTMFSTYSVSVSPHRTLNTSRGVISEFDLLHVSEAEILEHLSEQQVTAVRRITIRRNGQVMPTKHLILTFNSPEIPSSITAGYLYCRVRPYVPNPLRCFKCQRFGHSQNVCRGSPICPRCGQPDHSNTDCSAALHCINCSGDHPAYSRSCPKWIAEKEVQTLRTTQNMSYAEARRTVNARTPRVGVSYAAAVSSRKTYCNSSTQTDSLFASVLRVASSSIPSTSANSLTSLSPSVSKTSPGNFGAKSGNRKKNTSKATQSQYHSSSISEKFVPPVKRKNLGRSTKKKDPRYVSKVVHDEVPLKLHPSSSDISSDEDERKETTGDCDHQNLDAQHTPLPP